MISSGPKSSFSSGGALGTEIAVERVDGGIQDQVAIGASFQVTFDLPFDRRR
jgi:hypothetical protein